MRKLFTVYTIYDEAIIKLVNANNFVLIGGTAIEILMNKLRLKTSRKRSNNDLDFLGYRKDVESDLEYLTKRLINHYDLEMVTLPGMINLMSDDVQIDLLIDEFPIKFIIVDGLKLLAPENLFVSKFTRYAVMTKSRPSTPKEKERVSRDRTDLIDILKIIHKLGAVDTLEHELNKLTFDMVDEKLLNELVDDHNKL